jgi:hypothetical protein
MYTSPLTFQNDAHYWSGHSQRSAAAVLTVAFMRFRHKPLRSFQNHVVFASQSTLAS